MQTSVLDPSGRASSCLSLILPPPPNSIDPLPTPVCCEVLQCLLMLSGINTDATMVTKQHQRHAVSHDTHRPPSSEQFTPPPTHKIPVCCKVLQRIPEALPEVST